MSSFLKFLIDGKEVTVFAVLILLLAGVAYVAWFRSATRSVLQSSNALIGVLSRSEGQPWPEVKERARSVVNEHRALAAAWQETEQRVTEVPSEGRVVAALFGVPRDIWSARGLLRQRFNLDLADAVPNILVGVGLFFTFLFLTLALADATAAIGAANQAQDLKGTTGAISSLLKMAGAKFLTSLAGLLASIVWVLLAKRALRKVEESCESLVRALGGILKTNGGELLVHHQLVAAEDEVAVTNELLTEAREQTGALKRFETDLAISLAGAINPKMQEMTDRLVGAVEGLSNKLGAMNQEALEKMLIDFSSLLQKTTKDEMTGLRETLAQLAANLKDAGTTLKGNATGAADVIDKAGTELVARIHDVAAQLAAGAGHVEQASGSLKLVMNDLDVTMSEAVTAGRQGAAFVREAIDTTSQTVERLTSVSANLSAASTTLDSVGTRIAGVVEQVGELSHEQRAVVHTVREVAPNALAAVERVSAILDQSAKQTMDMMQETRRAMDATAQNLGNTVASITQGVGVYSSQVAELHRSMDADFAKAVGSFDKGVADLQEVVEELAEVMGSRSPA